MPSQPGTGVERKVKLCPTTGSKSLDMSHCWISEPCVSARHIFSGGWGISRSMMSEIVGAESVICPSFAADFPNRRNVRARSRRRDGASSRWGRARRAVRDSGFRVRRGDAGHVARLSTVRCLDTAGCDTPACEVRAWTVCSPSRARCSKMERRVGSARARKTSLDATCMLYS